VNFVLNEIEVNTPGTTTERCEYVEILGTAGTQLPANTFFLSVDGDPGQFGVVSYIADVSNVTFGANGTITIINTQGLNCPGRVYPGTTTLVFSNSIAMGFGAETFILVTSTDPGDMFEGNDLDVDDDGIFDASFGITPLDGIGWTPNPDDSSFVVYGGVPNLGGAPIAQGDVPQQASRFTGNPNPLSRPAWYYGHLAGAEGSVTYTGTGSFPAGAVLTPGVAPNSH